MTGKLNENELYEMTREFLSGDSPGDRSQRHRPKLLETAMKHLREVAPSHAKVIERYLRKLERDE